MKVYSLLFYFQQQFNHKTKLPSFIVFEQLEKFKLGLFSETAYYSSEKVNQIW